MDFGSDAEPKDKVTISDISLPGAHQPQNSAVTQEKSAGSALDVVCGAGGCNTTVVKNETNKDTIDTDIVVHLKTKIGVPNPTPEKTVTKEHVPDIPVVAGYGGILNKERQNNILSRADYERKNSYAQSHTKEFSPPGVIPNKYKENGVELAVPYFEPSYNNHYFGENPGPQYVWYPKSAAIRSPVAYRYGNRRTWSDPGVLGNYHAHQTASGWTPCTCQARQTEWYPGAQLKSLDQVRSPKIDGKLAPLE